MADPRIPGSVSARLAGVVLVIASIAACGPAEEPAGVEPMKQPPPIEDVIAQHAPSLMKIDGVVGVYESLTEAGEPCLKVMIVEDTPEIRKAIPESIDGYPVVLRETGAIGPRSGG